jgi:hypothetical protein
MILRAGYLVYDVRHPASDINPAPSKYRLITFHAADAARALIDPPGNTGPWSPKIGSVHFHRSLVSSDHPQLALGSPDHSNPVFDVMLQAISSPRAEGASPPLKDVPYSKKANTFAALQLHEVSCSYTGNPQRREVPCSSTRCPADACGLRLKPCR